MDQPLDLLSPLEYLNLYERGCQEAGIIPSYDGYRQWAQVIARLWAERDKNPGDYELTGAVIMGGSGWTRLTGPVVTGPVLTPIGPTWGVAPARPSPPAAPTPPTAPTAPTRIQTKAGQFLKRLRGK